ncbi:DUF5681 domain-containing protein [Nostoc sp. CHAB 5834]|nr:DUF5681 domain-containing protein [Nostoc sp. CHAB 5834]
MTKSSRSSHPSRSGPRQPNPEGYQVGPGNPPFPTRFERDAPSPNPGGRPAKKKQEALMNSLDAFQNTIIKHGETKMPLFRDGENVELSRLEAFLDVVFKLAVKGNPKALALYMMAQKEAAEAAKVFKEGILLAANEHIDRWLAEFLQNERKGKPMPPFVYPDPRDIIIHPDGSVEIVGPINVQQYLLTDEIMHHRDEHIELWDKVLMVRKSSCNDLEREWRKRSKHIEKMNSVLPPRLRKSLPPLEKYLRE